MCPYFDDSDIKIASGHPIKPSRDENDEQLSEELKREKSSGHLKNARRLGMIMAQEISKPENGSGDLPTGSHNLQIMLQRRILLAFAVAAGFEKYTSGSIVSRTALNAFYNSLKSTDSSLYDDLNNTGAFSFYYLALRRGGDVERSVGRTFAMLCGSDGDPILQELGETDYCRFLNIVKAKIEELEIGKQPV